MSHKNWALGIREFTVTLQLHSKSFSNKSELELHYSYITVFSELTDYVIKKGGHFATCSAKIGYVPLVSVEFGVVLRSSIVSQTEIYPVQNWSLEIP